MGDTLEWTESPGRRDRGQAGQQGAGTSSRHVNLISRSGSSQLCLNFPLDGEILLFPSSGPTEGENLRTTGLSEL